MRLTHHYPPNPGGYPLENLVYAPSLRASPKKEEKKTGITKKEQTPGPKFVVWSRPMP